MCSKNIIFLVKSRKGLTVPRRRRVLFAAWCYLTTILFSQQSIVSAQTINDPDLEITNRIFANKYHVIASRILRPNTVYKVLVTIFEEGSPTEVTGSLLRNGVSVSTNNVKVHSDQSEALLLQVPHDNSGNETTYKLRVEGKVLPNEEGAKYLRYKQGFVHESKLHFTHDFLSITISTNRAIYSGSQPVRIRVLFLTTSLKPYDGIADLYLIDPDDYVIRKWNSMEMNVGVLLQDFVLPDWPKVGFWTIRVVAEGQVEEHRIKVEMHFLPKMELVVVMPTYFVIKNSEVDIGNWRHKDYTGGPNEGIHAKHKETTGIPNRPDEKIKYKFEENKFIEASVEGTFVLERLAMGNVAVKWFAKKIDDHTPMYNDTVSYREQYDYKRKVASIYHKSLYSSYNPLKKRQHGRDENLSRDNKNPYKDPYRNASFAPGIPLINKWKYIRSDFYLFQNGEPSSPFKLYLDEILREMGTLKDIQVRCEAVMTEFFYNDTQPAFAETRIITEKLYLNFLGYPPYVFKPGMPYRSHVSIMFEDQVALSTDDLNESYLDVYAIDSSSGKKFMHITVTPEGIEQESATKDHNEFHIHNILNANCTDLNDEDANSDVFTQCEQSMNEHELFQEVEKENQLRQFRSTGVFAFSFDAPKHVNKIQIYASFYNKNLGSSKDTATAYATHSPKSKPCSNSAGPGYFIQVHSSTKEVRIGSYVVLHVKTNFAFASFDWLILNKDLILNNGREYGNNVHPEVKTFSVAVSPEMSPGFHIMVHTKVPVSKCDEIIADHGYIAINTISGIHKHNIEFKVGQFKNKFMLYCEATARGDPGASFFASTMRTSTFAAQGIHTINRPLLLKNLHKMGHAEKRHLHRVILTDREGEYADTTHYFPSSNYAYDAKRTFGYSNILMFSDSYQLSESEESQKCDYHKGELPCLASGCFNITQLCDGIKNCEDGIDEANCVDEAELIVDRRTRFRNSRQSRFEDFYDVGDGDWGWVDTNLDHDGEQFFKLEIPETPDDFYFHVFSVSKELGVAILEPPFIKSTTRPVDFYCEAPEQVRRGESIGIRCSLINRTPEQMEYIVVLKGSDDYSFINVEEYGYVTSYAPRLSSGDHHHFVWLRGETEIAVNLPIAPHIQTGALDVTVELNCQVTKVIQELTIEIMPEGSLVHRHTSVLLDLRSRANVLRFMNIIVDETPVIPYEVYRRYVSGSASAKVTLCGDVIGPIFPEGEPVDFMSMFAGSNHGRYGWASLNHVFNLGANTWQLHYLRLTNQWKENLDTIKNVFSKMNTDHAAIMRRFGSDGGLSPFDNTPHSVWLTAWCIKIYKHVAFQDWEDYIYIDPYIITSAATWLMNFQSKDGYFVENVSYDNIGGATRTPKNHVALTAHVLVALEETADVIQGESKKWVSIGRQRAQTFLQRSLSSYNDSSNGYEVAIIAYALALAGSQDADLAYGKLLSMKRQEDGMIYWGKNEIKTNRVRYEFNRPFLEAKVVQENDALAVEATSYALITMFLVEGGGVTPIQGQIVKWLNTMRLGTGGFISAVDTIAALQALVLYSYHSRIKDITDLHVQVDLPDSNVSDTHHIYTENIIELYRMEATNSWGHVNVFAKGAGHAVAQLDVDYGVDYEPFKDQPPRDFYNLTIQEFFHGRNKSEITIRSCFNWIGPSNEESGMTMLAVEIPSGYAFEQFEGIRVIRTGKVPELKEVDTTRPGQTIWYLNHVPKVVRCFDHTVKRYLPVANLTRTRQAVIMEPLNPERFFVRTFNATSLYILSICEVCGSYQCPFCPFYSGSPNIQVSHVYILLTSIWLMVRNS